MCRHFFDYLECPFRPILCLLQSNLDHSGFEDLMNNNEKLRGEKEELRAALSQLEEEVWQFRQKEVSTDGTLIRAEAGP